MSSAASAGGEVSETARGLLRCGVWAGPVYLVVQFGQLLAQGGEFGFDRGGENVTGCPIIFYVCLNDKSVRILIKV